MNILVLTSVYPQPDDVDNTVTKTVEYYCKAWAEAGHNVCVIHSVSAFPKMYYRLAKRWHSLLSSFMGFTIPNERSLKKLHRFDEGIEIYRYPLRKIIPHSSFSRRQIEKEIIFIKDLYDLKGKRPDLIVGHWVNPQLDLICQLKKFYSCKASLVFHSDCTLKNIKKFNINKKIGSLDAVGSRSMGQAKSIKEMLNLKRNPFICQSGIADDLYRQYLKAVKNKNLRKKGYLYVGRLVRYKNVNVIIDALYRTHPEKDFTLKIVGDGYEKEALKQQARDLGLEKNIEFIGSVSRDTVLKYMLAADCFCMVSDNETFGMVYIESMLAGCITIASRNGGVDGIIKDSINGFLCKQGSTDELTSVFMKIKNMNNEEKNLMRQMAVESIENFSDSKLSEKYIKDILEW